MKAMTTAAAAAAEYIEQRLCVCVWARNIPWNELFQKLLVCAQFDILSATPISFHSLSISFFSVSFVACRATRASLACVCAGVFVWHYRRQFLSRTKSNDIFVIKNEFFSICDGGCRVYRCINRYVYRLAHASTNNHAPIFQTHTDTRTKRPDALRGERHAVSQSLTESR